MLPHYPHMGVDDEKHLKRHIQTFYVELLGSTLYFGFRELTFSG